MLHGGASDYLDTPLILLHFFIFSTQQGKGNVRDAGGGVGGVVLSGLVKPNSILIRLHSDSTSAKNTSGSARLLALDTKTRADNNDSFSARSDFALSIIFAAVTTFVFMSEFRLRIRYNSFLLTAMVSSRSSICVQSF